LEEKGISQAVISRLPRYYRYLGELKAQNIERVSSGELSRLMHVTASQIRQDFNNFGGFGQQGYGYNVENLYDEIARILGLDHEHKMILIGCGNLGQALINYMNFRNRGFIFKGAFDVNRDLFGRTVAGIDIMPLDNMERFVREHDIDIAVLTVPKKEALALSKRLVACGIKGIWNFAHTDLPVPPEVQVENVHLSDSLMKLSYNLHRSSRNVSGREDENDN
jgi:redox-sensing transcriptional repressor